MVDLSNSANIATCQSKVQHGLIPVTIMCSAAGRRLKVAECSSGSLRHTFISSVEKEFPGAQITFDKFYIMKIINEAVDEVRRQEQKERPELARTRYIWLKNPGNLNLSQVKTLRI